MGKTIRKHNPDEDDDLELVDQQIMHVPLTMMDADAMQVRDALQGDVARHFAVSVGMLQELVINPASAASATLLQTMPSGTLMRMSIMSRPTRGGAVHYLTPTIHPKAQREQRVWSEIPLTRMISTRQVPSSTASVSRIASVGRPKK